MDGGNDAARKRGLALLHLHDHANVREFTQYLFQSRNTNTAAAKWRGAIARRESEARVHARQLFCTACADRAARVRRAIQGFVVNDHWHAVAGQMHVAFEAIGTQREAVGEGRHGVFGRELGTTAVREDKFFAGVKHAGRWEARADS